MPQQDCINGPVIHGSITISAGLSGVNYIGLVGLGFEKIAAAEYQISISYTDWADYKALLRNMIGCGVKEYTYTPAEYLI